MFSWFRRDPTNISLNATLQKDKAINDAIIYRSQLLKNACIEFKRLFPSQPLITFDEKQQLFNPWLQVFYDALLAIQYMPKALKICDELLNEMEKLAHQASTMADKSEEIAKAMQQLTMRTSEKADEILDAMKKLSAETAQNTSNTNLRNNSNKLLQQYLIDYNNVCSIDLPLHGKIWVSSGALSIFTGPQNIPYMAGIEPFDLISLDIKNIDITTQESAIEALEKIGKARHSIAISSVILTKSLQDDMPMLIAQIFIRMTPIFSQLTILENMAKEAMLKSMSSASLKILNDKFDQARNELNQMHIINTVYGARRIGCDNLTIQFGHSHNIIQIKSPIRHNDITDLNTMDLLSTDNAENTLSKIQVIKRHYMRSPLDTNLDYHKAIEDEESIEDHYNRLLNPTF